MDFSKRKVWVRWRITNNVESSNKPHELVEAIHALGHEMKKNFHAKVITGRALLIDTTLISQQTDC